MLLFSKLSGLFRIVFIYIIAPFKNKSKHLCVAPFFCFSDLGTRCYYNDKDYLGPNLNSFCSDKTDTVQQCKQLCQQTPGCDKFTYATDRYNGRFGEGFGKSCCLKGTSLTNELHDEADVVSGPKECNGNAPVKLFCPPSPRAAPGSEKLCV